ncbi:hypothetical protein AZE42_03032, partial [Rhizopogon vesiculosus]
TAKFRVAICGAGIGGLFLAVTIGKFADCNVQVDLYEAHDTITTAGTGIVVSRHIMEVMEVLGLHQEVIRVSAEPPSSSYGLLSVVYPPYLTIFVPPGLRFRKSDISQGGFEWFHRIFQQHNPDINIHRKYLVDILNQQIPSSCTVHFNKGLTKYVKQSAGSLVLHFADESTETTDVLIGADGIHSSVRKTLFETINEDLIDPGKIRNYSDASWTGTLIYRAIIPLEKLLQTDPENVALRDFVIVSPRESGHGDQE